MDDGTRVFCGGSRPPYGMMAELTVVSRAWCLPIPVEIDDVTAVALLNPALSAWLSLVWRAQLRPGETVLILVATGVAGKLAIQIDDCLSPRPPLMGHLGQYEAKNSHSGFSLVLA